MTAEQLERLEAQASEEDKRRAELLPKGTHAPTTEDGNKGKTPKEKRQWKVRVIQSYNATAVRTFWCFARWC